jgi:hypothetical protein
LACDASIFNGFSFTTAPSETAAADPNIDTRLPLLTAAFA